MRNISYKVYKYSFPSDITEVSTISEDNNTDLSYDISNLKGFSFFVEAFDSGDNYLFSSNVITTTPETINQLTAPVNLQLAPQ